MTDLSLHQEKPLKIRIWITRGCYFNMAERLRRKTRFSVGSNAFLSLYVICVSIYLLVPQLQKSQIQTEWLTLVTLALSICILTITLLESSKNYAVLAIRAQQKAQSISEVFNEYESSLNSHSNGVDELGFAKKYGDILGSSDMVRKPIDFYLFQFNNRHAPEFAFSTWDKAQILALLVISGCTEYWLYIAMVTAPPLALFWF